MATQLRNEQLAIDDGWIGAGETWTYASADAPTFTFTIAGVDLTGKYSAGMRVKLTQTTVKYFIITKVAFSTDTTITVYGGTDYTLANAAISDNSYSSQKAPLGFPLDPDKWTVEVTDTASNSQTNPTAGTWYNINSNSINIPIGIWYVGYEAPCSFRCTDGKDYVSGFVTLSTGSSTESDAEFSCFMENRAEHDPTYGIIFSQSPKREKILNLSTKDTYYLNFSSTYSYTGTIQTRGTNGTIVIRAVSAYL